MDDFGMGYALGQDSGSSCRDGGSGMWGGDGSWIFAFLIIALIFGGRGGLFGGGWGGNSGDYGDGINSPAGQGALTRGDLCMVLSETRNQSTTDDIFYELKQQDTRYLKRLLEGQQKILDKLAQLEVD